MKKEFKIAVRKDISHLTFEEVMMNIFPKFYRKNVKFMNEEKLVKLPFEKLVGARIQPLTLMTIIRTNRIGFLLEDEGYDILIGEYPNYPTDNTHVYDLYTFRFYGKDATKYMYKVLTRLENGTRYYPTRRRYCSIVI